MLLNNLLTCDSDRLDRIATCALLLADELINAQVEAFAIEQITDIALSAIEILQDRGIIVDYVAEEEA
jgi:hypothetical protein